MILEFNNHPPTAKLREAARETDIEWQYDTIPVRLIAGRRREFPTLPDDAETDELVGSIENVVGERPVIVNS